MGERRAAMLPRAYPHPFPAARRWALLTVALLGTHAVLAWLALQASLIFIELAWRALAAPDQYRLLVAAHIGQFRVLRGAQAVLWGVTAVTFVRWVVHAERNLLALGVSLPRDRARRTTAAFLVPGSNLFRPLAIVAGLWHASDPRRPAGDGWRRARPPARVLGWWLTLIAAIVADGAARAAAVSSDQPLDLGPAMLVLILAQILTAAAAVLGIVVVLGLDRRQDAAAWERAPPADGTT